MLMPKRHGAIDSYRYGFQGQEKDDEVKGEGNSLNYKYRMHDPRVGRFFAVDPLFFKYPSLSTYQFGANTPIMSIELEGLEAANDPNTTQQPLNGSGSSTDFVIIPENGVPLSEIVVLGTKRPKSDNTTRSIDLNFFTTEVGQYEVSLTFEQYKEKHGIPKSWTYEKTKAFYEKLGGSYWEEKFQQWNKEAREERLRQKLWIFTSYFYMAEDVMLTYSGNLGFSAATAKVTSNSYNFSGILSKQKSITEILQKYTDDATRYVDDLADDAFTAGQFRAIQKNPNLRPMFRGNRIDVRARQQIGKDGRLQHLEGKINKGPDFFNRSTKQWWDITTPGAWGRHKALYELEYGQGHLLSTATNMIKGN